MKQDNQTNFESAAVEPASNEQTFSISELAKEFDITTRSIRFYEDQGLISPERNGQTRSYSKRDKVRLKLILRGKRLGFTLAETGRLFELYDADKSSAKQLVTMLDLIAEKKADLSQQMDDMVGLIQGRNSLLIVRIGKLLEFVAKRPVTVPHGL